MVKCVITNEKIPETFLNKILGTVIKDENGKKYYVSSDVQKKFASKEELLQAIKEK